MVNNSYRLKLAHRAANDIMAEVAKRRKKVMIEDVKTTTTEQE